VQGSAVVFDCDGLLLDTEKHWTKGEEALFAAYGRTYSPEHKRRLLGTSGEETGRILARLLDQPGRERSLIQELRDLCEEELKSGSRAMPGAEGLVARLHGRVPLGVASNSPKDIVEAALRTAGFDGAFEVVLGCGDVTRPKPHPEIYLTACERLGAPPGRSVAFEDSRPGVAAALAAGLYVIGVPSEPGVSLDAHQVMSSLDHPSVRAALAERCGIETRI
jgi:HAD superfamily hydrolase (TIGR01509 family)